MNQRVLAIINETSSHYSGQGYQYFYSKDAQRGAQAKLQIAEATLREFEARVGRCNSFGLPHLQVLDQGNGWWLVTSLKAEHDGVVMQFLRRLNKWMLSKGQPEPVLVSQVRRQITVRNFAHSGAPRQPVASATPPKPTTVSRSKLEMLADTINEKYGHTR
jgi:hypothetical protein